MQTAAAEWKVKVNVRILLVEDDAPFRRSLESFLRRARYSFDSCATAREALNLAATHDYSMVVVEYQLPDANGVDLIKRLRALQAEVRVIYLSVYDYEVVANEVQADPYALFLKKPFDPGEFEWMLRSVASDESLVIRNFKWKAHFKRMKCSPLSLD